MVRGLLRMNHDLKMLYDKAAGNWQDGDVLIISGQYPGRCPTGYLQQTSGSSERKRCTVIIVDTNGAAAHGCTEDIHPFLIKPNMDELRDVFGEKISAEEGAEKLQKAGARNVIVSMGGDGALLKAENGTLYTAGVCQR